MAAGGDAGEDVRIDASLYRKLGKCGRRGKLGETEVGVADAIYRGPCERVSALS